MRKGINDIFRRFALRLLPLACVAFTASCMQDEEGGCGDGGNASVQIHVTADVLGDLNASRAMAGDANAVEGEFMNELCVFVVDASTNVIEWKGNPALADNKEAQKGNLTDYTFRPIELTQGSKKIYAFANWSKAGSTEWTAVINKKEKDTLTDTDLAITIDDPAAKVDFAKGSYIPMSAVMDATVTANTGLLSIGLDRLVSKVSMTVKPTDITDVTVKTITFSGIADKVALLSGGTVTGASTRDTTVTVNRKVTGGSLTVPDFYINETKGSAPFGITMTTDQYSGMTYAASTARTEIPRNSIYPLTLTFSEYTLDLEMRAEVSVLGVYPLGYTISADNKYIIEMAEETSKFTIKPTGLNKSSVTNVTWTWNWDKDDFDEWTVSDTDKTLTGAFSAVKGQEIPLTLNAKWTTDNGKVYDRTYTLLIKVTKTWEDILYDLSSRAASTVNPEIVNLFIKK